MHRKLFVINLNEFFIESVDARNPECQSPIPSTSQDKGMSSASSSGIPQSTQCLKIVNRDGAEIADVSRAAKSADSDQSIYHEPQPSNVYNSKIVFVD